MNHLFNLRWARIAGCSILTALVLGGNLSASPATSVSVPAAPGLDQSVSLRSTELLKSLQEVASDLNRDAQRLGTFSRPPRLSWQSHAFTLVEVRDNINAAGRMLRELQEMQHAAAPWQQLAVSKIHPVALELATHTQAAIEHLNQFQSRTFLPSYTDRLTFIADRASEMKETVDNFVDYADAQGRLDRLEQTIGLASS
jgi:hypothetical protein